MTKFEVNVTDNNNYNEYFWTIASNKLNAMKKGIELARKCDNIEGELIASARVLRELNAEQNCMVNV